MPRRDRFFMARMTLEGYVPKKGKAFQRLKRTPSELQSRDVAQPLMFGITNAGEGIIRVPVEVMKRLGWEYGQRVFLSELPPGPIFAESKSLMVEVE